MENNPNFKFKFTIDVCICPLVAFKSDLCTCNATIVSLLLLSLYCGQYSLCHSSLTC